MARLVINDGSTSRTVELTDASTVAGRAPENKVVIDDKQASRRHFTIDKIEFGFKLVDLESRNGTRVNDRQVNQLLLRPGDRIQIGHHTLTFEDPNFREPPAGVAARISPPAVAPVAEAAPDRPAALPVAVEVAPRPATASGGEAPKPATAAAPAASAPAPEPPIVRRNRSGHTTAVSKVNVSHQLKEEQKTLTMVAVGAGVFIFIIIILILLPNAPSDPGIAKSPAPHPVPSTVDQDQIDRESHDFEELSNFNERNRNTPSAYAEIVKRVDDFEKAFPRSPNAGKAREYRSQALNGMKTSRNAEFTQAEHNAQDELKKNNFGAAFTQINGLLAKFKTDADIHERLAKLKDEAVDLAKNYFRQKASEADGMKSSRKDEARDAYRALLKIMGNGLVPELDDYCKICRASIDSLQ